MSHEEGQVIDIHELVVDIRALIEFFDINTEAQQDSSSIKAIIGEEFAFACMSRYFKDNGATSAQLLVDDDSGRRIACTTGGKRGYQLDGWFWVVKNGIETCYQTEVKSWSFHGIGSVNRRMLIEDNETNEILKLKRDNFATYYNSETKSFKHDGVKKVLLKMKPPDSPKKNGNCSIQDPKPLLCLWEAVCQHDKSSEIFFNVPVELFGELRKKNEAICQSGGFDSVYIFSVSNYLRSVLASARPSDKPVTISLPLPRIEERMRLLSTFFTKRSLIGYSAEKGSW